MKYSINLSTIIANCIDETMFLGQKCFIFACALVVRVMINHTNVRMN